MKFNLLWKMSECQMFYGVRRPSLDFVSLWNFSSFIVSQTLFESGRVCLVFSLLLFIIRLLKAFTMHKLFGPKLLMLGRMVCSHLAILFFYYQTRLRWFNSIKWKTRFFHIYKIYKTFIKFIIAACATDSGRLTWSLLLNRINNTAPVYS